MPRIQATTVKEHHDIMLSKLVDAAEELLRNDVHAELTAGAVSNAAGIARNSIYRYVTSVDELRGLVIAKHLPVWMRQVDEALEGVKRPRDRIVVWAQENLRQASTSGHSWLIELARSTSLPHDTRDELDVAHGGIQSVVVDAWDAVTPDRAQLHAEMSLQLLVAGFHRIDAGDDPSDVIDAVTRALRSLMQKR